MPTRIPCDLSRCPLTRSRPIAVEQNVRDNVNNVVKSGRVAVRKLGEFSINNGICIQKSEKTK